MPKPTVVIDKAPIDEVPLFSKKMAGIIAKRIVAGAIVTVAVTLIATAVYEAIENRKS